MAHLVSVLNRFPGGATAAEGGEVRVEQPSAQQAPIVVNCQFRDFDTTDATRQRHRTGLEDFQSGAPLFVSTDEGTYTMSERGREMYNVGLYLKPEEQTQPGVFSSLEVAFYKGFDLSPRAVNDHLKIQDAVNYVYKHVRLIGFADTEISLQKDHTRNSSGSLSVITRAGGDKTSVNTGLYNLAAATDVCWFCPNDPVLRLLNNGTSYPWPLIPGKGSHLWRPITMPLSDNVIAHDIRCTSRVMGRTLRPAVRNAALTLIVSTRPVMPHIDVIIAGMRAIAAAAAGAGGAVAGADIPDAAAMEDDDEARLLPTAPPSRDGRGGLARPREVAQARPAAAAIQPQFGIGIRAEAIRLVQQQQERKRQEVKQPEPQESAPETDEKHLTDTFANPQPSAPAQTGPNSNNRRMTRTSVAATTAATKKRLPPTKEDPAEFTDSSGDDETPLGDK